MDELKALINQKRRHLIVNTSDLHNFRDLENSKLEQVWSAARLWHVIQENLEIADGFVALFFQLQESLHHNKPFDFMMTLWCIWKRRNDKLWNNVETQPHISVNTAWDVLLQWQQVCESQGMRDHGEHRDNGMTEHRRELWTRPSEGAVKCNVDAIIFKEQGCYGLGMCLRGDRRDFIGAKTKWYKGLPQPNEVEARGLREAINWLGSLRFPSVSNELDCKQAIYDISTNLGTNSIFGAIMNSCNALLMNHQNFKIRFIRRQANNVVHLLARASLSYASFKVHDYMSSYITSTIIKDMN